ncbi:MAG: type II toxin-antitoxin system RelE/ParE family toxin [Alphaproteobacteria bacterium]|nr:type II toxin-antitoxin system RelE/ParE family toxin [Alphaproteobacteria bacterium]
MTTYSLSNAASADVLGIAKFSLKRWGEKKAKEYVDGLKRVFAGVAERPQDGKVVALRPKLRRVQYRSHYVFYRIRTQVWR